MKDLTCCEVSPAGITFFALDAGFAKDGVVNFELDRHYRAGYMMHYKPSGYIHDPGDLPAIRDSSLNQTVTRGRLIFFPYSHSISPVYPNLGIFPGQAIRGMPNAAPSKAFHE